MDEFNLNNKKIESGFIVPENYFEDFESRTLNILLNREKPKVISIWKKKRLWMTSLAAVLLISISFPVYFSMNKPAEIDEDVVINYLETQSSINTYEIVNQLSDEDISSLEENLSLNVDEKDMEEYLNENVDDLELYLNE